MMVLDKEAGTRYSYDLNDRSHTFTMVEPEPLGTRLYRSLKMDDYIMPSNKKLVMSAVRLMLTQLSAEENLAPDKLLEALGEFE
jgi:hypothetical protein